MKNGTIYNYIIPQTGFLRKTFYWSTRWISLSMNERLLFSWAISSIMTYVLSHLINSIGRFLKKMSLDENVSIDTFVSLSQHFFEIDINNIKIYCGICQKKILLPLVTHMDNYVSRAIWSFCQMVVSMDGLRKIEQ